MKQMWILFESMMMHLLILVVVIGLIVAVTVLPADKEREIK